MRKFLLVWCFLCGTATAAEPPARAGLVELRAPLAEIVQEGAKGRAADFERIATAYRGVAEAWRQVMSEPLDLADYGVAEAEQEDIRRQVRMLGLLVGYLDEAVRRGDRALALRAANLLDAPYRKVAQALGAQ